jgi:hypothetical protein
MIEQRSGTAPPAPSLSRPAFLSPDAQARALDAFLAARGLTRDAFTPVVAETYGHPLVALVSGSILQGIGNDRSDIDLYVVVEQRVARVPIPAFADRLLLDTVYFTAAEVEGWPAMLRDHPWPPSGPLGAAAWKARVEMLMHCMRFSYGLVLSVREPWDRWAAEFREPWFAAMMARWWRVETLRRRVAFEWLADAKPLLAAQRAFDAVLAAFESRAAARGLAYSGQKWVTEKLRALGDTAALDAIHGLARVPYDPHEAPAYLARCRSLLDELGHVLQAPFAAQLWLRPGVAVHAVDRQTLISRWRLRGLETRATLPPLGDGSAPFWQGPLDAPPPADTRALFVEDMTWLSIVAMQ